MEIAVTKVLTSCTGIDLNAIDLAKIGQAAENNFVGCRCGIMDQLISASAVAGKALLIDCQDYQYREIAIPDEMKIVMINSNVQRGLVDSEYNTRHKQCEAAAAHFGVDSLRRISLQQFEQKQSQMEPVVALRAQHVLEENQRTLDAATALIDGDNTRLSRLMAESHQSMKNLFEITVPAIDTLVNIVASVIGERGGVRMTGGGFGGCVVALAPQADITSITAAVNCEYPDRCGLQASIYLSEPAAGVSLIEC